MSWSRTFEGEEPVRVNKWLAQAGVCSRREAEGLIAEGRVAIDGERVEDVGRKILPGQTLTLDEAGKGALEAKLTVLVHKPVGVVSSQPEGEQVPAVRLLRRARLHGAAPEVFPGGEHRLAPLGRLDMDSRGLLILSEDGVLAKAVIGPDSELDKEYFVQVRGAATPEAIRLLRHGLELDERRLRPAKVTEVSPGRLRFVLTEGRNRQIRRMCELVGLEVVDLMRVRIGPIALGDLPEGMWRPMTAAERAALLEASKARAG
jgi:23S rRNA pseudouridine2604 synthase